MSVTQFGKFGDTPAHQRESFVDWTSVRLSHQYAHSYYHLWRTLCAGHFLDATTICKIICDLIRLACFTWTASLIPGSEECMWSGESDFSWLCQTLLQQNVSV